MPIATKAAGEIFFFDVDSDVGGAASLLCIQFLGGSSCAIETTSIQSESSSFFAHLTAALAWREYFAELVKGERLAHAELSVL